MTAVVGNAARNLRRRHHRAQPHQSLEDEALVSADPEVGALLERAEEHVALLGCVNQLASLQRQVVTLRMLEELSAPAVAQTLGLTRGHVAVLLHRSKQHLLACLVAGEEAEAPQREERSR
jgi:RNA polymerase sigma-70 factor (ECF subfamily)